MTQENIDLMAVELALEEEAVDAGATKYRSLREKRGDLGTEPGRFLLKNAIAPRREKLIEHETPCGRFWVLRDPSGFVVMRTGCTHSTADSTYPLDDNGLSLAKARAKYLAKMAAKQA